MKTVSQLGDADQLTSPVSSTACPDQFDPVDAYYEPYDPDDHWRDEGGRG